MPDAPTESLAKGSRRAPSSLALEEHLQTCLMLQPTARARSLVGRPDHELPDVVAQIRPLLKRCWPRAPRAPRALHARAAHSLVHGKG